MVLPIPRGAALPFPGEGVGGMVQFPGREGALRPLPPGKGSGDGRPVPSGVLRRLPVASTIPTATVAAAKADGPAVSVPQHPGALSPSARNPPSAPPATRRPQKPPSGPISNVTGPFRRRHIHSRRTAPGRVPDAVHCPARARRDIEQDQAVGRLAEPGCDRIARGGDRHALPMPLAAFNFSPQGESRCAAPPGRIAATGSSTDFWITQSILSPAGSACTSVTASGASHSRGVEASAHHMGRRLQPDDVPSIRRRGRRTAAGG